MPIYTYRCESCGHEFEELVLSAKDAPEGCPVCGASVRRTFSGSVGLVFKGSGFYITDYARKSSNGSEASSRSKSETSSSAAASGSGGSSGSTGSEGAS